MNVSISSASGPASKPLEWMGRTRPLIADGAVDHFVWDQVTLTQPDTCKDNWLANVRDPRLQEVIRASFSQTPEQTAALLGADWRHQSGLIFTVGDLEGCHQRLELGRPGGSGREFKLATVVQAAGDFPSAVHTVEGRTNMGMVSLPITKSFGSLNR